MTPHFPVIEIFDRYAIAQVKFQKTNGANSEELTFYKNQIDQYNTSSVELLMQSLYNIHNEIWDLESELKSGCEHNLPLEEIGRRAIAIRNHNNKRINIKNTIAESLGCVVKEIKQDHLSDKNV
jgi:hypothetical protein